MHGTVPSACARRSAHDPRNCHRSVPERQLRLSGEGGRCRAPLVDPSEPGPVRRRSRRGAGGPCISSTPTIISTIPAAIIWRCAKSSGPRSWAPPDTQRAFRALITVGVEESSPAGPSAGEAGSNPGSSRAYAGRHHLCDPGQRLYRRHAVQPWVAGGCLEGDPPTMWTSLSKLMAPADGETQNPGAAMNIR